MSFEGDPRSGKLTGDIACFENWEILELNLTNHNVSGDVKVIAKIAPSSRASILFGGTAVSGDIADAMKDKAFYDLDLSDTFVSGDKPTPPTGDSHVSWMFGLGGVAAGAALLALAAFAARKRFQ